MEELHPSRYPWPEPARTGWLGDTGFVPGPMSEAMSEDLDGRVPVVAVGSNASPTVLSHKLGPLLRTGLPIARARVEGLGIGHSAHVSARGYVAAAPLRAPGTRPVTLCWFDEAQLAALDATEPNYRRVPLPGSMPCLTGPGPLTGHRPVTEVGAYAVTGVEVYESVHGVLGEASSPLALRDQGAVLAWLAERLPDFRDVLHHDRLTEAPLREQVRRALIEAELRLPSGL